MMKGIELWSEKSSQLSINTSQSIQNITKHMSPMGIPLGLRTLKETMPMIIVAPGISMPLSDELMRMKQSKSHQKRNPDQI